MKKTIISILILLLSIFIIYKGVQLIQGINMFNPKKYAASDFIKPDQYKIAKAIMHKDAATVEKLVANTDLNGLSKQGMSLLMLAVIEVGYDRKNNYKNSQPLYKIITTLMQHGADITMQQAPPNNPNKINPLYYVFAEKAPVELLQAVLDGGLDPNYIDIDEPLISKVVTRNEQLPKLKLLVSRGADVNTKLEKQPIVIDAATSNAYEIVLFLLEHGVDINAKWADTNLPYAVYYNELDYKKTKIEVARNKQKYDKTYYPIIVARLNAIEKCKDFLIKAGIKWPPPIPESQKQRMAKEFGITD